MDTGRICIMENEIVNILGISNVMQTSIFLVSFVLAFSHKRNIENRKVCYAIGVFINIMAFLILSFLNFWGDIRRQFIVSDCVMAVLEIIFILIINGDKIGRKIQLILLVTVPVRVVEYLLLFYFGWELGQPLLADGNHYIVELFVIFVLSLTIEYYAFCVLFVEGRQLRNEMGSILMFFLFPILGFMDVSFALRSGPGEIGPYNLIFGSIQLTITAAVSFALLRFMHKSLDIIAKEREQIEIENLRSMDLMYYDIVQADIEFARKFRHDAANYTEQIEFMIDHLDDNSEGVIQSMVEELKNRTRSITARVYSSDPLTNVILTLKAKKCADLGLDFNVKVNLPEDFDFGEVEPLDRSSILSNMIDNAIESSVLCKEAGKECDVNVSIGLIGDYLALRVENYTVYDGEINEVSSLMKQINEDRKNKGHGYGMVIIQEKVAKYKGDIVVNVKDNKCVAVATVVTGTKEANNV